MIGFNIELAFREQAGSFLLYPDGVNKKTVTKDTQNAGMFLKL
jgi:hypothetical protein